MTQSEAITLLKTGQNVFLTGPAGSGKTFVLNNYVNFLKENNISVAITASTGIAATHLGGVTIHGWSGLGIRDSLTDYDIDALESRQYLWKRYESAKVLVIDEISMLHHFRFDLLDRLARSFKRNDLPFGGMQVVLCGDFFQLPPVSRPSEPEAYFAYRSKIWGEMGLKICYLEEQHRQSDASFLKILNAIRNNSVDEEVYELLNSRYNKDLISTTETTKLATHNIDVDAINDNELKKIKGNAKRYLMTTRGKGTVVEGLIKSCLAPQELILKIGARVMFVKNNYEKKFANGTLGTVESFNSEGFPQVRTVKKALIDALPQSWVIEEDGKIKAEISQVPLRLAWAITVHKSQGMSLDAAEIDLSRSFAPGMGYVALSRVRSLEGLSLVGFNNNALQIHPEVQEIDRTFRKRSEEALAMLEDFGVAEIKKLQEEFLAKNGAKKKTKAEIIKELPTHEKTKLLIDEKIPLEKIAKARNLKIETVIDHIEKLIVEKVPIDIEYLKKSMLKKVTEKRFKKIESAFKHSHKNHGDLRLAPVKLALGSDFNYQEIRLARLFVEIEPVEIF